MSPDSIGMQGERSAEIPPIRLTMQLKRGINKLRCLLFSRKQENTAAICRQDSKTGFRIKLRSTVCTGPFTRKHCSSTLYHLHRHGTRLGIVQQVMVNPRRVLPNISNRSMPPTQAPSRLSMQYRDTISIMPCLQHIKQDYLIVLLI